MIPRMASTFASGDKEKLIDYLKKSFKFVYFLSFPMIFGIMSISKSFVPVFFGSGYEKVVTLINVMAPNIILNGMASVIGTQYLLPTKKQKEYTMAIVLGLIANFILNYILIKTHYSIGASIATIASELVLVIAEFYVIRKDINIKEVLKSSFNYLLAGLVMLAICILIQIGLGVSTATMVTQIIAGVLVYIFMLVLLKDEYLVMFKDKIKNIVIRKN